MTQFFPAPFRRRIKRASRKLLQELSRAAAAGHRLVEDRAVERAGREGLIP